jgi:hypothetical protein
MRDAIHAANVKSPLCRGRVPAPFIICFPVAHKLSRQMQPRLFISLSFFAGPPSASLPLPTSHPDRSALAAGPTPGTGPALLLDRCGLDRGSRGGGGGGGGGGGELDRRILLTGTVGPRHRVSTSPEDDNECASGASAEPTNRPHLFILIIGD